MRKFARSAGVASDSLHDQASGTPITRPSTRWTTIWSRVTRTFWMRGSAGLVTMLVPRFKNNSQMSSDQSANPVQFAGAEAVAASDLERLEPELAGFVIQFNMNVRRFSTIEAREKETVRSPDTTDSRHLKFFSN